MTEPSSNPRDGGDAVQLCLTMLPLGNNLWAPCRLPLGHDGDHDPWQVTSDDIPVK